jgi:hypothetical protein
MTIAAKQKSYNRQAGLRARITPTIAINYKFDR